jgi:hypothetical protein
MKPSMVLDKIEGYEALVQSGMHVVRARYVDSEEDAIAFAARRAARDERAVPIVLRALPRDAEGGTPDELVDGPLAGHDAVRAAYGRLTARLEPAGGRILAAAVVGPGTDVAIEGRADAALGKVVALHGGGGSHGMERMIPFGEDGAARLVEHFQEHDHRPHGERTRKMLEHLLMRVAAFFAESGVESFALDPVRLHDNGYTILDATLRAAGPLHLDKRLAHDARDRKGYGYHPSGRQ